MSSDFYSRNRPIVVNPVRDSGIIVPSPSHYPSLILAGPKKNIFETVDELNRNLADLKKFITKIPKLYPNKNIPSSVITQIDDQIVKIRDGFNRIRTEKDAFLTAADKKSKRDFKVKLYRAKAQYRNLTRGEHFGLFKPIAEMVTELKDVAWVRNAMLDNAYLQRHKNEEWGRRFGQFFADQLKDAFNFMFRCFTFGLLPGIHSPNRQQSSRFLADPDIYADNKTHNPPAGYHSHPHSVEASRSREKS